MRALWTMRRFLLGSLVIAGVCLTPAFCQFTFNEREVKADIAPGDKSNVWALDFRFKDPRLIKVNYPTKGTRIFYPVFVDGANLSVGDLHFSQGDGEITFCGAIEMSGFVDLHVDLIKGGMDTYGVSENAIFMPGIVEPQFSQWLAFSGTSVHRGRCCRSAFRPMGRRQQGRSARGSCRACR